MKRFNILLVCLWMCVLLAILIGGIYVCQKAEKTVHKSKIQPTVNSMDNDPIVILNKNSWDDLPVIDPTEIGAEFAAELVTGLVSGIWDTIKIVSPVINIARSIENLAFRTGKNDVSRYQLCSNNSSSDGVYILDTATSQLYLRSAMVQYNFGTVDNPIFSVVKVTNYTAPR
jgi:hypothetical protein